MTAPGFARAAAWTGPVLVVLVASRVASGGADAPLLVLLTVTAPLLALLRRRAAAARHPVTDAFTLVAVGLVVWANVIVCADVAWLLGAERWQGAVLAAAVALLVTEWPAAHRRRALALAAGIVGVLLVAVAAGVVTGMAPWRAWSEVASRPAFVFSARGAAAGARFVRATTLRFEEAHRVAVLSPGVYRVAEQEGARTVVREWHLRENDALTLRPGDELSLPAGAHVRFETGKRVPAAPPSGVRWADAPVHDAPGALPAWLGLAVTLLGGAVALVPPAARGGATAAVTPLVCVLGAVCCGVYAVVIAPDLTLGGEMAASLVGIWRAMDDRRAAAGLTVVACAGLLALFIAAAQAMRERVVERATGWSVALWAAVFALATLGSVSPVDAWLVLSTALGFAASACAAPWLGASAEDGEPGGATAVALGSMTGALAFGALVLVAARLPGWAGALGDYPALLAAPVAWSAARVTARYPSARTAGGTARSPSATSGP